MPHNTLRIILWIILIVGWIACRIEMIRYNKKSDKNSFKYENKDISKKEFLSRDNHYNIYKIIVEMFSALFIIYWLDLIFLR